MSFNTIGNGSGMGGASTSGALIFLNVTASVSYAQGEWAVTAP